MFGFHLKITMAIEVFNKAGERLAKKGITMFYHCHGFEFQPSPEGTLFDYIVQKTNPQNVRFEMGVYWAFHGGAVTELILKNTQVVSLPCKLKM